MTEGQISSRKTNVVSPLAYISRGQSSDRKSSLDSEEKEPWYCPYCETGVPPTKILSKAKCAFNIIMCIICCPLGRICLMDPEETICSNCNARLA